MSGAVLAVGPACQPAAHVQTEHTTSQQAHKASLLPCTAEDFCNHVKLTILQCMEHMQLLRYDCTSDAIKQHNIVSSLNRTSCQELTTCAGLLWLLVAKDSF